MNRYKELRKNMGLTQEELAQQLHLNQTTVGKWETEKSVPDYQTLINLSKFYGVSIDYLVGMNTQMAFNVTNDLGILTPQQTKLFKMIQKLDNDQFYMVYGYTERLLRETV